MGGSDNPDVEHQKPKCRILVRQFGDAAFMQRRKLGQSQEWLMHYEGHKKRQKWFKEINQ